MAICSKKVYVPQEKRYKIMAICSKKVYVPCDVLKYCLMKIVLFPQKLSNYNYVIIHTHLENIVLIQKIIDQKVAHPP
jgi:hypothetical protein